LLLSETLTTLSRSPIAATGEFAWLSNQSLKVLTRDVRVAADALLVLMQYQNKGYALMSF